MLVPYRKLVRDNIPDICIKANQIPKYRILNDDEYEKALCRKLKEETREFLVSKDKTELADILEVIEALANIQDTNLDELLKIKEAKAKKNGKFEKRYYLESVKK